MLHQLDYLSTSWLELDGRSADVVELLLGVGRSMRVEGAGQWSCLFEWGLYALSSGQRHDAVAGLKKEMVVRELVVGKDPISDWRHR